jgi:hypothetical protein
MEESRGDSAAADGAESKVRAGRNLGSGEFLSLPRHPIVLAYLHLVQWLSYSLELNPVKAIGNVIKDRVGLIP